MVSMDLGMPVELWSDSWTTNDPPTSVNNQLQEPLRMTKTVCKAQIRNEHMCACVHVVCSFSVLSVTSHVKREVVAGLHLATHA